MEREEQLEQLHAQVTDQAEREAQLQTEVAVMESDLAKVQAERSVISEKRSRNYSNGS